MRKEIKIYITAVIIVIAASPLIYWVIQNQMNIARSSGPTYYGNYEVNPQHLRLWTALAADSWSGMTTGQEWSFTRNLSLKATITVVNVGSKTFYTEMLLVDQGETDEGYGFQITSTSPGKVTIRGWSYLEGEQALTSSIDKDTNTEINLEAKKTGLTQIDFYVNNFLIGTIKTPNPSQEGILNIDVTNGVEGGQAEVVFTDYQVVETT